MRLLLLGSALAAAFCCWLTAKDTCVECHAALEGSLGAPVAGFDADIHKAKGLGCVDCHGGDREADDPSVSMSRAKGFLGKFPRTQIPKACARCHSNAAYMHRYAPQQRVDQHELYLTSTHGKRLAQGDTAVATCIDCHSVHGIRGVRDPLSPVSPLRLPETCAHCHADPKRMSKYKLPTDQFSGYRTSVHWDALFKRGDLSAPSCGSCHGNHGAAPPNADSVAAVCSMCHVMFGRMYEQSPHKDVFSGSGGGCVVCHSNHAIHKPSVKMLTGSEATCLPCHDADSPGGKAAAQMGRGLAELAAALERSQATLEAAQNYGMEVSEAQVRLIDGQENLVKARLVAHSFRPEQIRKPVEEGIKIAKETQRAAEAALREKDMRRLGLGVSVAFVLITMCALWMLIRRLERNDAASPASAPDQ